MRRQGLAYAYGIALLTVVLVGAPASAAAAAGVLATPDDQPCSCSGETPAAAGVKVAATQPPPSISGLSPEGVYFIPEPLPAEETQEACSKKQDKQNQPDQREQQGEQQQILGPLCSVVGSQGWEHPSSYTASIVFAPVRATHAKAPQGRPHTELAASGSSKIAAKERVREGPKTADEGVPAAAQSPRPESPDILPEHIEGVFSAAQKEVQQLLAADSQRSSSNREREHHPEGLCRRGRAPTHAERRQQFLLQFGEEYSLKAEETAQKELRRLKGDIYMDYAGQTLTHTRTRTQTKTQPSTRAQTKVPGEARIRRKVQESIYTLIIVPLSRLCPSICSVCLRVFLLCAAVSVGFECVHALHPVAAFLCISDLPVSLHLSLFLQGFLSLYVFLRLSLRLHFLPVGFCESASASLSPSM